LSSASAAETANLLNSGFDLIAEWTNQFLRARTFKKCRHIQDFITFQIDLKLLIANFRNGRVILADRATASVIEGRENDTRI
jgi:hypothetical protein